MASVGQSEALRAAFARAYAARRPRRLLVLGCSSGEDFAHVDPTVTFHGVGVDLHDEALARARARGFADRFTWIRGDVLDVDLPGHAFDLVHAALILEYVDPKALFGRITGWLAPDGTCATVTQDPGPAAVTATRFTSLRALEGHMTVHDDARVAEWAEAAALVRVERATIPLPHGKSFTFSLWRHA